MKTTLLEKYAPCLCDAKRPQVRDPRLLMDADGDVEIYYAPFEYIHPDARIVLVGITPGSTQMLDANNEARDALQSGQSFADVLQAVKSSSVFNDEPLRTNLIRQFNHWGFHKWLRLSNSAKLFSTASHLMQTTSLLRYPVFVRDSEYRGSPDMMRHPLLRKYLLEYFVTEVEELPDALFIGVGPQVQRVLEHLVRYQILKPDRVLGGLVHPADNCTYRINYLVGDRSGPIPSRTYPAPYDEGREAFRKRFLKTRRNIE
ncbi:MAG: hypothetical protein LBP58_02835 [Azoarcus sp.]|nr:hypothetical protein [Azoarcus sp.]